MCSSTSGLVVGKCLYAYILVDVMPLSPLSPYLSSVSLQRYHMNWCPVLQCNHVVAHDLHSVPFERYIMIWEQNTFLKF